MPECMAVRAASPEAGLQAVAFVAYDQRVLGLWGRRDLRSVYRHIQFVDRGLSAGRV